MPPFYLNLLEATSKKQKFESALNNTNQHLPSTEFKLMSRGLFNPIIDNEVYQSSNKEWFVELSQSWMYWYDLLANPNSENHPANTKELIVEYLRELKKQVDNNLEKRFIYFICSRAKVRFNTDKKPAYNPITGKYKFHLLTGKEKKKKSIKIQILNSQTSRPEKFKYEISEKYITLTDGNNNKATYSVHDFLSGTGKNLGYASNIEYVGYTKNPDSRPTNGSHSGLSDIIYKTPNDDRDIFIFFNIFKVTTKAINQSHSLGFFLSNPMTNEIDVNTEGQIIEKSFILYFNSSNQQTNKPSEKTELENNLRLLGAENNIGAVHIYYEFDLPTEYWLFSSSTTPPQRAHEFTVKLESESLEILTERPTTDIFNV